MFRSAGAVVLWWAWLVFAVATLAALAAHGHDHSSVVTAILLVAVTGVVYGCALWPRIVADENGISVLNPVRGHRVPWVAVAKVDLVNAVRVHATPPPGAARGAIIYSWAVQSSARARLKGEATARRGVRQGVREPAVYAKLPRDAREAMERSPAEFIVAQLGERAARERARAASERPAEGPSAEPSGTCAVQVSWAWPPIAAMILPVLALIIAVLS